MATTKTFTRSFTGGEISPETAGHIDNPKVQTGLFLCRNFICKPQGPAINRPGTAFVREVKDSTKKTRIIPFTFSTTQTMVIEIGAGYMRFHTQGATLQYTDGSAYNSGTTYAKADIVKSGGINYYSLQDSNTGNTPASSPTYWYAMPTSPNIYEIPNSYAEDDLFAITYVQSSDVLTLTHVNYPPQEIRRYGATKWILQGISFNPVISAPTGVSAVASGITAVKYTYNYVVTAIAADGISESVKSANASVGGNLLETGGINTISWTAVSGALRYNVYKLQGGIYGYIGNTTGTSIVDDNIKPDMTYAIPNYDTVFAGAGDYPGAVSYHDQRRIFAGTTNEPQSIWMTKSGTESNMSYSLPTRDEDRIKFRVAARQANTIRHIVPLTNMLLLTSAAIWRVNSLNSDALTPSSFNVQPQAYIGSSPTQPSIINNSVLYVAAVGGHIIESAYNWQAGGFVVGDLSLYSAHLFDGYTIVDKGFSRAPYPIDWCISSNGKLLGLTYVPDQQVGAWHQHDTDGLFESIAVVNEGIEEVPYFVVKRTINGVQKRYIEQIQSRQINGDLLKSFFVDCGLKYTGSPATTFSGLSHLEGKTVSILADGCVHPQRVVTSGQVTLDQAASVVVIGLPITSDIQTPPAVMAIDSAYGQGRYKNVNKVWMRVYQSSGIFVGPDADHLTEYKQRTDEPYGTPPSLKSAEIGPIALYPSWGDSGQLFIRQSDPLPLDIVSVTMEIALGS